MKEVWKILFLIALFLNIRFLYAQRFFYVEANKITEKAILRGLSRASQIIVKSPLISDYIIKTTVGLKKGQDILNLDIVLQDSVTFRTVFQTSETYAFAIRNENAPLFFSSVINNFIEKNMDRMVLCAKNDHYARMRF